MQDLLGRERPNPRAGECAQRLGVALSRLRRQLVGLAQRDRLDQPLDVVGVRGEIQARLLEQLGAPAPVFLGELVERLDHADSEEMAPVPVHRGARELRIVRGRQEPGERRALLLILLRPLRGAQEVRLHGLLGARDREVARHRPAHPHARLRPADRPVHELPPLLRVVGIDARRADLREESRHPVEILLRPLVEGMVVALRALDLHAQERPREFARERHREVRARGHLFAHPVVGQAVLRRLPLGGDERAREFVEFVGLRDELLHRLHHAVIRELVLRRVVVAEERPGPVLRPILRVLRAREQPVEQLLPLRAVLLREEGGRLLRRRDPADDVEARAAVEFGVVAAWRRLDLLRLPFRPDDGVDERRAAERPLLAGRRDAGDQGDDRARDESHHASSLDPAMEPARRAQVAVVPEKYLSPP